MNSRSVSGRVPGESATPTSVRPDTAAELLRYSQIELYRLFRESAPGPIPTGRGKGTPVAFPGTLLARIVALVFGLLAWRGKVFRPATSDLKNLLTYFSFPAIRAQVYRDESWFDGAECTVLDYTRTSRICGWIRDEIREVRPGLYLGLVYGLGRPFGKARLLDVAFILEFDTD